MKIIEKKSVVPLPQATGSISDTINVEDKVNNAPSINLVQQMTGIPQEGVIAFEGDEIPEGYEEVENGNPLTILNELANPTLITPAFTSNVTNANGGYYKIGKLIIVDITCKFTTTNNSGVVPCYLPTPKTTNADGFVSLIAISLTDNSVAPSCMQSSSLKVIPSNITNTYRISGIYVCE